VKKDLVGQSFIAGEITYTVTEVQDLAIQRRFTDKEAKTDEVHTLITASVFRWKQDWRFTARGVLIVHYKHFEQGWKLQSVDASGVSCVPIQAGDESQPKPQPGAKAAAEAKLRNTQEKVWVDQTGLMWTTNDNGRGDVDWNYAVAYCKALRIGEFDDWQLPSIDDLKRIYVVPGQAKISFSGEFPPWVWSRTKFDSFGSGQPQKYQLFYASGGSGGRVAAFLAENESSDVMSGVRVLCVRSSEKR